MRLRRLLLPALLPALLTGCFLEEGDRDAGWDQALPLPVQAMALSDSVALLDTPRDELILLSSPSPGRLESRRVAVGRNAARLVPSPDLGKLYVLSTGVQPRRSPDDERPSLTLVGGGPAPSALARWELGDPLTGLAVDPLGEHAVAYASDGVVENPNELIFVRVKEPRSTPVTRTLRSLGGRPQRLHFTEPLGVPVGEPRRFLLVEADTYVSLLDLGDLERPELTVELPRTPSGAPGRPVEVVWHDGDPADPTDARIAVRLANDSNVLLLELAPPTRPDRAFSLTLNVADVGGVPSAIDFVATDGGLRLAALVPGKRAATLVDPTTTVTETVALGRPYSRLSRITEGLTVRPDQSDVALLYSPDASGVAFWSLGRTTGTPYRSVDPTAVDIPVSRVHGVPGEANAALKILESPSGTEFYVFDLNRRTAYPMVTEARGFQIAVAPDGGRAWAYRPGSPRFASLRLSDLHPVSLEVEREVSGVYDVARADGGRALLVLHQRGGTDSASLGVTLLDALSPDTATSTFFPAIGLGGLP